MIPLAHKQAGIACTLIAVSFFALAFLSRTPPVPALAFVVSLMSAWAGYAGVFSTSVPVSRWAVGCALAARIAGLWGHPVYEDDWARYLWDGFRFLQDGTPYGTAPSHYFENSDLAASWQAVLAEINNPDVPTIYAPTLQYVFAFSAWISPASLTGLKIVLIFFDLGTWFIISRIGGVQAGLRYALCPLVIFEVSFNAHADVVGAFLITACFALIGKDRLIGSGAAFGLALACKPFALIMAPCFLRPRWHVPALAAAVVLTALYLPFLYRGATERAGLASFAETWEFNSFGFAILQDCFGNWGARRISLVLGTMLCAALMVRWIARERPSLPPADFWLLSLLFFAPVVNPWYLLWAVPWACLRPSPLTWSVLPAISLSYLTAGVLGIADQGFYNHPSWVRPLEVFAAIVIYSTIVVAAPILQKWRSAPTETILRPG